MKTYVLPGISTAQRGQLSVAGIPFSKWGSGILITGERSLGEALAVLGATATETATDYEDFVEILLHYGDAPAGRTGGRGNFPDLFDDEYGPTPTTPNGNWDDEWPYATPDRGNTGANTGANANTGGNAGRRGRLFDEYGNYVGPHQGTTNNGEDGGTAGGTADAGDDGATPKRRKKRTTARTGEITLRQDPNDPNAQSRQNYVNACRERLEEVRENSRAIVVPTLDHLLSAQRDMVAAARSSEFAATANANEIDVRERFAAEIQRIRETAKVDDVRVVPNGVVVFTEHLFVEMPDGKRRADIGKFMIWIKLSGTEAGVYWFNKTRRVNGIRDGMNAPYVYMDGRPSAEEILHNLIEMIGRCELAAVVDMAIQFVESILPENPLTEYLDCWPMVKMPKGSATTDDTAPPAVSSDGSDAQAAKKSSYWQLAKSTFWPQ